MPAIRIDDTRYFALALLLAAIPCPIPCAADTSFSERQVLTFDAGPGKSALARGAIGLDGGARYTAATGFGWTSPPEGSFSRSDLSRSRTALTIDGVAGSSLEFRADVSDGAWSVIVLLEMDPLHHACPQILLQQKEQSPAWQVFPPSAEPRKGLPKTYRVFHSTAAVGSAGLVVALHGKGEEVRLLAISLIKVPRGGATAQPDFLDDLEPLHPLDGMSTVNALAKKAYRLTLDSPQDSYLAIWNQRLSMTSQAETLASLRGWRWADKQTGIGMFDRYHQAVMLLDGVLAADAGEPCPLADRARFLRGRLLYWLGKERGGAEVAANAERDLALLARQYPEDELLGMYNGKRIDTPDDCDRLTPSPAAPAWSVAQREALCRLRQLVHWWTERQNSGGEMGGKLGDDVELLRWWSPLCLSGDDIALRGWRRLSDGVWQSEHVTGGYARRVADVEHASEFIADTAPLMAVYTDAPEYQSRLELSAELFKELWTDVNPQGHRFFRSAWFSSTSVDTAEPKNRDVELNTRAARALRYLAWRQQNAHVTKLLHEWSLAWAHAAMQTGKGKPPGIIPASVRFEDGAINGAGSNWYEADLYWDYFDWEHSAGSLMLDQLLFTYFLTRDEQLLQPLLSTLEVLLSAETADSPDGSLPGSQAWAAEKLRQSSLFWGVVEQWRFHSGDPRFDDLILRYGNPYGRYRVTGDESHLVKGMQATLQDLRYNTSLKTNEALFTDRVYVAQWELLKAMLTGDGLLNNTSPYFQVTWQETDEHFTALVDSASEDLLTVQLFSHAEDVRRVVMRVWRLPPGRYLLRRESASGLVHEESVEIVQRGHSFKIALPTQQLLRITLTRQAMAETTETDCGTAQRTD